MMWLLHPPFYVKILIIFFYLFLLGLYCWGTWDIFWIVWEKAPFLSIFALLCCLRITVKDNIPDIINIWRK